MSEEKKEESIVKEKAHKKKPKSPTLDFKSERFDPLRALYAEEAVPQNAKVKIYDNLSTFEAALNRLGLEHVAKRKPPITVTSKKVKENVEEPQKREFLPHQLPVQSTFKLKQKHERNLLLQSEKMEGPLALLTKYMKERIRVTVYTRNEHRVRGYTSGYIEMFDKHWNLALFDVVETWTRRKHYFSAANVVYDGADDQDECDKRLKELGIKIPDVEVKSLNRKYVRCTRKVNSLLVRGEQVVVITPEVKKTSNENKKK